MIMLTAKFPLDKAGLIVGEVKIEAKLLPDGLVRFDVDRKIPEAAKKMFKGGGDLLISLPAMDMFPGMSFNIDGNKYPVIMHDNYTDLYKRNKFKTAFLDTGSKMKSFTVNGLAPSELSVSVSKYGLAFWMLSDADGKAAFSLDLREGIKQTAYAGIDIKATDDLNTPTWSAGRNLIQNSSFETGFRYWKILSWTDTKDEKFFEIDNSVSKFGKSSLLVRKALGGGSKLMSFTFPLDKGKKYTGSFWAKSDGTGNPALQTSISTWIPQMCRDKKSASSYFFSFKLANEWKRYSFSFVPEGEGNNAGSFTIGCMPEGAKAWIDGVQFEEGELSDFHPAPCAELLVDGQPAANVDSQSPLNPELILHAAPENMNGTVKLTVENFQKIPQFEGSFGFRTDDKGEARIKLPWKTKDFLKGINIVRAEFTGNNLEYTDYFRFNIMDYLKGTHKNKDMFSTWFANYVRTPDKNIYLKNLQCFGVGALGFYEKGIPSKEDLELLKTYRISQELVTFASRPDGYMCFTPEGVPYEKVHILDGERELAAWDGRITTV
ncbi:MAG: carbohydrate binding domain-containing protein, partial [Lentisphaerae bacterium]|nr:carbohydrate binding domain-containing protein [Lentisphaerota bacterium]